MSSPIIHHRSPRILRFAIVGIGCGAWRVANLGTRKNASKSISLDSFPRLIQISAMEIKVCSAKACTASATTKIEDTKEEHLELCMSVFDKLAEKVMGWVKSR